MNLLTRVRQEFPEIPVVLLTAHGSVETAVDAMKRGAHDFLTKPFDKNHVLQVVEAALRQARESRREFQGPPSGAAHCGMVGSSRPVEYLRGLIEKIAPSPSTVLILGETGTGKELVANAIHDLSPRRDGPLIRINSAAIPENLVEAELFGYERSAFTGADRAKPGRFELADRGTLFLDEVGDLPSAIQAKLLRVLQDGKVDRVGSTAPRVVDVRLIAATHRDLESEVKQGRFRADLYFRLRVLEIRVPALRDRLEDLPLLVDFFLDKHSRRLARARPGVAPESLQALARLPWPGNVRELESAVERAILLAESEVLQPSDFFPGQPATSDPAARCASSPVRAAASDAERRVIRAALAATGGNVTHAALRLGLSRRGLQLKMKGLGLREGTPE
jgi:DNA-binding NtrC family response regulator